VGEKKEDRKKSTRKVHHSAKPSQRGYKRYRLRSPEEIRRSRKGTEAGSTNKKDAPKFLEVHDIVRSKLTYRVTNRILAMRNRLIQRSDLTKNEWIIIKKDM
jgi:hypothetical protein